jgi:cell division protein FtsN
MLAALWFGCSSSEESVVEDDAVTQIETEEIPVSEPVTTPQSVEPVSKAPAAVQRFTVQADTVVVEKKKRQSSASTSISVKASAPKKFYTVEVGAFRMQSNVQRHKEQLAQRFKLPVRVLYDSTLKLTRVCVGTFSSRNSAMEFITKMNNEYPKEYPGLWVSYWTK